MKPFPLLLLLLLLSFVPREALSDEPRDAPREAPAPEEKPRPYHPEPRVIVNVVAVKGPHERAAVERALRLAWGRIVACYESIDRRAKGVVNFELVLTGGGRVSDARRIGSTLRNRELEDCLTKVWKGLAVPKARARSVARAELHVAPGDP